MRRVSEKVSTGWRPDSVPDQFLGFVTSIDLDALREACVRLDVRRIGSPLVSYTRRAIGSRVIDSDGSTNWVKVSAVVDGASNWMRRGETDAASIHEVPKPKILRIEDWSAEGLHYRALMMSLALSPSVEPVPLAGKAAAKVRDDWIDGLKRALNTLRAAKTERYRIEPSWVPMRLRHWFGLNVPIEADEWHAAHGDLNWANLTSPVFSLLDWETWGLAPQGFDVAYLIAYSCAEPELCHRLEVAFAHELETRSGRVAHLLALGELLSNIDEGWLHVSYHAPAEQMARRVLSDLGANPAEGAALSNPSTRCSEGPEQPGH